MYIVDGAATNTPQFNVELFIVTIAFHNRWSENYDL